MISCGLLRPCSDARKEYSLRSSQEVLASATSTGWNCTLILWNSAEYAELWVQILTDVHDGCNITTAIAVIWSRPNGNNGLLGEVILNPLAKRVLGNKETYLVAFIDQLMSARNKPQAIDVVEFSCDLVTKEPASTTWRDGPGIDILGIRPDQVAESAFMGNFLSTSNDTDLIDSADFWGETTVNAKDFTINNGSEDQEIENLAARLPD